MRVSVGVLLMLRVKQATCALCFFSALGPASTPLLPPLLLLPEGQVVEERRGGCWFLFFCECSALSVYIRGLPRSLSSPPPPSLPSGLVDRCGPSVSGCLSVVRVSSALLLRCACPQVFFVFSWNVPTHTHHRTGAVVYMHMYTYIHIYVYLCIWVRAEALFFVT